MSFFHRFWLGSLLLLGAASCSSTTLDGGSARSDGGDAGGGDDEGGTSGSSGSSGTNTRVNRGLGENCEVDDQCKSGLTCHQNFVANQCTAQKTCTLVCQRQADCIAIDPKARCFTGCGNEEICMLTL